MTPNEFVIWFRGFVEAANSYNITPKQWDSICEHLESVKEPNLGVRIKYNPAHSDATGQHIFESSNTVF